MAVTEGPCPETFIQHTERARSNTTPPDAPDVISPMREEGELRNLEWQEVGVRIVKFESGFPAQLTIVQLDTFCRPYRDQLAVVVERLRCIIRLKPISRE